MVQTNQSLSIKSDNLDEMQYDKIRIITNADGDGNLLNKIIEINITQEELTTREENRNKYLLWMNFQNGDVFVLGERFASKLQMKSRKLIEFLLKKYDSSQTYDKIYGVYTGDWEDVYAGGKHRKRINKWVENLCKYSNGILKKYIFYDPGISVGFNTKGLPFLITYGKVN